MTWPVSDWRRDAYVCVHLRPYNAHPIAHSEVLVTRSAPASRVLLHVRSELRVAESDSVFLISATHVMVRASDTVGALCDLYGGSGGVTLYYMCESVFGWQKGFRERRARRAGLRAAWTSASAGS